MLNSKQRGRQPKPKEPQAILRASDGQILAVRVLPPELVELKAIARKRGHPLSVFVRIILREFLLSYDPNYEEPIVLTGAANLRVSLDKIRKARDSQATATAAQ